MTAQAEGHSNWRLYVGVLTPSLLVAAIVAILAITNVKMLSGVRAFVGAESLWSKSRADAVQHLRDFALTRNVEDFALFDMALAVPEGDRRAREQLLREEPDLAIAREGFIAGGNHPEDIDNMMSLIKRFGKQDLFAEALEAWSRGDELIDELRALGYRLHQQISTNARDQQLRTTLHELQEINAALIEAEKRFSGSLGAAARVTENFLVGSVALTCLLLSAGSLALIRRTLKRQAGQERELAKANELWTLAANAGQLGLFVIDPEGDAVRLDARAASLMGLGEGARSITRASLRTLIDSRDREQMRNEVSNAIRGGTSFRVVLRVTPTPGDLRRLQVTGRADHSKKEGLRLVGVVRDVTDEDMQNRLAVQRDAAERVAQSQRFFLSRLSHELRTPLNAILGFAQLLMLDQHKPLSPAQREQVQHILTGGQQLLALIEDVLDLSKVDSGEIAIALQSVPLLPLFKTSMTLVEGVCDRYQVRVVNDIKDSNIAVQADPQRLQQVFINLLSNGCKYNKPGGQVRVSARHLQDERVCIDVEDDGIGMTDEEAAQLFQPFKRLGGAASLIEGTGLGLYIVKQLVERMGGEVSVTSRIDQGTRFSVCLPASRAEQATETIPA